MTAKINSKFFRIIARINRELVINRINRKRLRNHNFSIISNNCIGALVSHDLRLKFLTPTVNLSLSTKDFIKFTENMNYYLQLEIEQIFKKDYNYPIGKLGDIEINFVHYHDIENAKEKWKERSKRINFNNLFIMMTDNDGCSEEIIQRFEKLPFNNKILFTNKNYDKYPSTYYIKGFENNKCVGDMTLYKNILGKKYYDSFDYIKWLNGNF